MKNLVILIILLLLTSCSTQTELTDKDSPIAVENICDNPANKGTMICP
jgi:uncharacterized lipoprotein YajG